MTNKPSLPKGTRDFGPTEIVKRNYIFDIIKKHYSNCGYAPIETPVMESLSTLTGKYGDEGDRLLFKILNNGDYLSEVNEDILAKKDSQKLLTQISKRGLRYDLTVPFARFVVMNQHAITLPFKRYQIQQVWRADRPQRGRYQEFYQCDADVVGSNSLMYEAELLNIYDAVFSELGIPVCISVNNRKLLEGMVELVGAKEQFIQITSALDKLDKIGWEGVEKELSTFGLNTNQSDQIKKILGLKSLEQLIPVFKNSEIGILGIQELQELHKYLDTQKSKNEIVLDLTLARGLSYYTGCIFEVKPLGIQMGSLGGGGRYDNLTGIFGMPGVSGVGISFGAERIYDVMQEMHLFPELQYSPDLLIVADEGAHVFAYGIASKLRDLGVAVELYPDPAKFKKQMKYANDKGFKTVMILGSEEMAGNFFTIKTMITGAQVKWDIKEYLSQFEKA